MQSPPLSQIQLKNPTRLTQWVIGLLGLQVIFACGAIVQQVYVAEAMVQYAAQNPDSFAGLKAIFDDLSIANGLYFVLYLCTSILILRWIYVANSNVRQMGAKNLEFTPGWSIGWYFIPIANFWKPYQALQEIWQASLNPRDWQSQRKSELMPFWWFCWIGSGITDRIFFIMADHADDLHSLLMANNAQIVHEVNRIPLIIIFLLIVRNIYQAQKARAIELLGSA